MTKKNSDLEGVIKAENVLTDEAGLPTPKKRTPKPKPAPEKVVALCDQLDVARHALYAAARAGETDAPVPDVLARALTGTDDVLLATWRAWDIYATHDKGKWIIRADMVR
jgi:hypothetical protein